MATLDTNIALGVRPIQLEDPLVKYGQMQNILAAKSQNKLAEANLKQVDLAMQEAADAKTAVTQIMDAARKNGAPTNDPMDAGMQMLQHPNPKVQAVGQHLVDSLQKIQAYQQDREFRNYGKPQPQTTFAPGALGSGTFDPNAPNQLAPAPAAAPVANALAAPSKADQLFAEITDLQTRFPNSAAAKNKVALLTKQWEEASKAHTVAPGGALIVGGKEVYKAKEKPSEFEQLLEKSGLSDTDKTLLRVARAKKESSHAPGTTVNIDQKQESAFATGLGKGQSDRVLASQVAAQDAAAIIDTVKTGRDIMKSGMITGAGADFLVNFNQALKTAGIDSGYADAAANSQAFTANMAGNVGKLIKQFGAGTGLSDADREFAKDMAGGRISLDSKAINRILDINERAARNVISRHNKDVKGIKTNIPLEVEMPPSAPAAPAIAAPASAISYLRANPSMKGAFDAKYGAGAADRALKGQ